MIDIFSTNFFVVKKFALLSFILANAAALGIPAGQNLLRMAVITLILIPLTAIVYVISGKFTGIPQSQYEEGVQFLHNNFSVFASLLAIYITIQILGLTVLTNWCQGAMKKPCSPQGLIASEICPKTGSKNQFTTCVQQEAVVVMKAASNDLRFASALVSNTFAGLADAMNAARGVFNQIRTGVEGAFTNMLNSVLASTLPAVRSGLHVKAMMGQMQAVLASVAYLLLAGLMSMKAAIGGFLQVSDTTVEILGSTLGIMLAVMFFAPWLAVPAAVIAGILAIVADPLILVSRMAKGLGIQW